MFSLYVKIPIDVIKRNDISSSAKLLYGVLTSLSKGELGSYATNSYLSKLINRSNRSISDFVKELNTANLITIKYIKRKRYIKVV